MIFVSIVCPNKPPKSFYLFTICFTIVLSVQKFYYMFNNLLYSVGVCICFKQIYSKSYHENLKVIVSVVCCSADFEIWSELSARVFISGVLGTLFDLGPQMRKFLTGISRTCILGTGILLTGFLLTGIL